MLDICVTHKMKAVGEFLFSMTHRSPSMVTTSLCRPSLCTLSGPPSPARPLLLSGLRTTLAAEGAPEVRNFSCSLRRSASESDGFGRRNIPLKDTHDGVNATVDSDLTVQIHSRPQLYLMEILWTEDCLSERFRGFKEPKASFFKL